MLHVKTKAKANAPSSTARSDTRRISLATEVARELENQILSGNWPIGFRIGNESELSVKLGISRWTLREALRILEVSGLVESRRGAGGGLFVASNAYDFVCKMVGNYFDFIHVSSEEFGEISRILGRKAAIKAIKNLSDCQCDSIKTQLNQVTRMTLPERMELSWAIKCIIMKNLGNPALILYFGTLNRMAFYSGIYSGLDDNDWHNTMEVLSAGENTLFQAIVDRQQENAIAVNDRLARLFREWFEASLLYRRQPITAAVTQRSYDFFPPSRPLKKADGVQRELREIILQAGGETGFSLGSEKELVERFGVGRWVLREALRSLEQLGVIEVERGGHGGIRVVSPDPVMIAEACRRHLRREGLRRQDAVEARAMLEEHAQTASGPTPINDLFRRVLVR